MTGKRSETDSIGSIEVDQQVLWGAQTQRSLEHFSIGHNIMPYAIVRAYSIIKEAAAIINEQNTLITASQRDAIVDACQAIRNDSLKDHFPLHVWQTGSGTQTNMNVNEVIANYANEQLGSPRGSKKPIHPNDDVNRSQSSNDTFPTAMHISFVLELEKKLFPALAELKSSLQDKTTAWKAIVKIGRTHLQDAVPLTLGQAFSAHLSQIDFLEQELHDAKKTLLPLAIGATAVGTGLNARENFDHDMATEIARITQEPFTTASNKFQALSAHPEALKLSSTLKNLAATLYKLAHDIRMLGSGPRAGLGELILPKNEPGSSIMPGKVNPTQSEALCMLCMQVMGYDTAVTLACSQGHFELNVNKPLIAFNILESIQLLSDGMTSFNHYCLTGLEPNNAVIQKHVEQSLMLVTALTPAIGYDKASEIANLAHKDGSSLKEANRKLGYLDDDTFDRLIDPTKMV